ncbi:MAG: SAM-dependent methyltransferase [Gemmataceae bacterium]|nr:SAM-dependent methyltransferase [Gemmataceae bacterium]
MLIGQEELYRRVKEAEKHRTVILETGDYTPHLLKEQQHKLADESLNLVRFAANLAVAAFFAGENDKKREAKRSDLLNALSAYLQKPIPQLRPNKEEGTLREGPHPILPFHWEIEFPEVFGRKEAGFDVIVGNPPFLGGKRISTNYGDSYRDWLVSVHQQANSNADLVAHFFRRAFELVRPGGTFGLIATNTIAQGDTRSSGLRWICTHGGTILAARRRYRWPGQAAVVVSVVHISKGPIFNSSELDGNPVERITAYLFHAGGHDDPAILRSNAGRSFIGCDIKGQGFLFDDNDEGATPLSVMKEMTAKKPEISNVILPYIGGEEINTSPTHSHHRFVIHFREMSLEEAKSFPDLLTIVESKVKPQRQKQSDELARWPWWQFWRVRSELYSSIQGLDRVLACSQTSKYLSFAQVPSQLVFSHKTVVFPLGTHSSFCVMQSRAHLEWSDFLGSSMKDDPVYTPSDCFETFPFPEGFESNPALEAAGKAYYEFRADLMVRNNEGLTKTYNRFHDPNESSADVLKLRELHDLMDRAVLDAYGGDLAKLTVPPCEFLLDYEDDDEGDEETGKRQRKKPWRYRWPDAFRDEVLALLLELNKQRAEQEQLTAPAEKPKRASGRRRTTPLKQTPDLPLEQDREGDDTA